MQGISPCWIAGLTCTGFAVVPCALGDMIASVPGRGSFAPGAAGAPWTHRQLPQGMHGNMYPPLTGTGMETIPVCTGIIAGITLSASIRYGALVILEALSHLASIGQALRDV